MIAFEAAAVPSVRVGEALIAGRRLAGRLLPYGVDPAPAPVRFDPVERRFPLRRNDATVQAGPADSRPWSVALERIPAGPVIVGPCASGEEARGAFLAAAAAALDSGRPVYLLDPEPSGLPAEAAGTAVVLCSWRPDRPDAPFPGLATARAAGYLCAALFPVLPDWTGETESIEALVSSAAAGGAASISAVIPWLDGEGRRAIVEARAAADPAAPDRFFELVHHGDWSSRLADRLEEARAAAIRHGLAAMPPRPRGWREPPGNSAAAARLEEKAELTEAGEHRVALLHAAVRWIDECGRDLAVVERDGNFRKIFPFAGEVAGEAESALRGARAG